MNKSLCGHCANLYDKKYFKGGKPCCIAYPDGIPDDVYSGERQHTHPFDDQPQKLDRYGNPWRVAFLDDDVPPIEI